MKYRRDACTQWGFLGSGYLNDIRQILPRQTVMVTKFETKRL